MQINFDSYPAAVRKENKYLREALGSEHGRARYQWAWSNDLMMPMINLDDHSKPIYDYHCACGINVSVHSASCTFSVPRVQWEMRNIAFGMKDQWIFVRWAKPEFDKDDWETHFGSAPYPEGGYFVPVSDCSKCIAIHDIPFHATSEVLVRATREHLKKSAKEHTKDISDGWDRRDAQRMQRRMEQFKDAFPVHEGFPGKKENWSQGGIGESPVLVKN